MYDRCGNVQAIGFLEGNLHCLHVNNTRLEQQVAVAATTKSDQDLQLWHRRYGHLGYDSLCKLLNIPKHSEESNFCDVCIKSKIVSKPFPKAATSRASAPLELIHSDVIYVLSPESIRGEKYVLTFVDDYSRFSVIYLLKHKSDVFEKFLDFKALVERQLNAQIKCLRSDHGGEYMSTEFENYLRQNGIARQLSLPDASQQNGVAERHNRTLADITRCLLADSGLPLKYWVEAIRCAAYLYNRRPTKSNNSKTPYEKWFSYPPGNQHFRTFGCRVWMKAKNVTGKFEPRGIEGTFIGYAPQTKAYIILNHANDKLEMARDVIFDGNLYPAKLSRRTGDNLVAEEFSFVGEIKNPVVELDAPECEDNEQISNENVEPVELEQNVEVNDSAEQQPIRIEPTMTRSGRRVNPPRWLEEYDTTVDFEANVIEQEPSNLYEATLSEKSEEWYSSIIEEFENLLRNEVWTFTKRKEGKKVIRSKWTFKTKLNKHGKVARYKARLVALGNYQRPGVDFDKTYSPVVKISTTRMLCALTVENNWEIDHVDVVAAYLTADLEEETYIEIPQGFIECSEQLRSKYPIPSEADLISGNYVCKLNKCMYGLSQSGRAWNRKIDKFLRSLGMIRSKAVPCVYYDLAKERIVTLYVDDMLIYGTRSEINAIKRALVKEFEARDLGKVTLVQSIRVKWKDNTISLDQAAYANKVLREFNMERCKPVGTPLVPNE